MEQHGDEAHIGEFAVMAHAGAADSRHQVAAEEAELSRSVNIFQRLHQMRGMEVARGFTGYQIILHSCQDLIVSMAE